MPTRPSQSTGTGRRCVCRWCRWGLEVRSCGLEKVPLSEEHHEVKLLEQCGVNRLTLKLMARSTSLDRPERIKSTRIGAGMAMPGPLWASRITFQPVFPHALATLKLLFRRSHLRCRC